MDYLSPEKRSWNMSRIRSDKTKPEQLVASYLREHHMGYRRSVKDLPGKPDFVLYHQSAPGLHTCLISIRHQFRPSRSVTTTPQKPGLSVAHASQSFGIGCLVCSVTSSLTASRSLASSPSPSSWHYDTHSGRHPNKTSPSGSYSQTAPRSEHTPSPLKHPGSHHTPDAP